MKKLLSDPLFLLGLALRLVLVAVLAPKATAEWYAPFLEASTARWTLDPWGAHLAQGGSPAAFPYGYVMWLVLLPLTLLCKLLGLAPQHGYVLTLLAADFGLLLALRRMLAGNGRGGIDGAALKGWHDPRPASGAARDRLLLGVYWLSPIVPLATYCLGLNDLIPVLLLTLALEATRKRRMALAGALCAAALSAKLSMVLALPFFLVYLTRNRSMRHLLPAFMKGLLPTLALFCLPFAFSPSAMHMLFSNPEMGKAYQFALPVGNGIAIYVLPLAYLLMLYLAWRVRRLNFGLFSALLGLAFLLVVLLTPASPGWFIWVMPLLVFYQALSGRIAVALTAIFSVLYVLGSLHALPAAAALLGGLAEPGALGIHARSLLHTAMSALGIMLALRIWRETVSSNDYFRLSRKPFVIGIAGDSGAGKDTLADSLKGLFGSHSVAHLSGDDYHVWDRQRPMWQVMTHLNPRANDLEGFANDLVALTDGKAILSRHYDHSTGKMSRPFLMKSNDFIIASGLHALFLPILRNCYNLSIYLDIDEGLRRYYKLQRDVHRRGHSVEKVLSSLEKREPDSVRFIRPQAAQADLVMSLLPIHPRILEGELREEAPRVKLFVRSRNALSELSLARVLVGVCGLHVDMDTDSGSGDVALTIEGETSPEDIALAATMLFPGILEFLDGTPDWKDGPLGLMQLVALAHIQQALNRRLI